MDLVTAKNSEHELAAAFTKCGGSIKIQAGNWQTLLLHGPTESRAHSEKDGESKNCDRNGPEGQFVTDNTPTCNGDCQTQHVGSFMIQPTSIKVSMKKKRKEEEVGEGGRE